jgi:hypothetical protein
LGEGDESILWLSFAQPNTISENLADILDVGFHHTNDIEKVVGEKFPEAKQVNPNYQVNPI